MNQFALIAAFPSLPALIADAGDRVFLRVSDNPLAGWGCGKKCRRVGTVNAALRFRWWVHPLDLEIDDGSQVFDQQPAFDRRGARPRRGSATRNCRNADERRKKFAVSRQLDPGVEFARMRHGVFPVPWEFTMIATSAPAAQGTNEFAVTGEGNANMQMAS